MKNGRTRFEFQINKLNLLLVESKEQSNPALWLFEHDLRTPCFVLEALSKLYTELHNAKTFEKLRLRFKELEDSLGAIDYYYSFQKEFASQAKIPKEVKSYLEREAKDHIEKLNQILRERNWLNGKRLAKVNKKLDEMKWLEHEFEIKEISSFYSEQIKKLNKFILETTFVFDNVELDIHELRRKLRWLSIYAQALLGAVHLEETKPLQKYLKKYMTQAIVKSPYNVLPISKSMSSFLTLDKNHFYALSWMIAELGRIKDDGLRIHALQEALGKSASLNEKELHLKIYKLLPKSYPKLESLLQEAGQLTRQFSKEKILEQLVK